MSASKMSIVASGLSKTFGGRRVLHAIDLEIDAGQSVALTGANGAGKTTLLRCLAGLSRPTAGEVRWFGLPSRDQLAVRRLLGMVAHENCLYPHLTSHENLVFAARMAGVSSPRTAADLLLQSSGLQTAAGRRCEQLSKGMRQRLAVLRAIVHGPKLLLLDEPFSNLDVEGAAWLLELLADLRRRGTTLCFTAHDERIVQRLADRVVVLSAGRLCQPATPSELRQAA